MMEDGLDEASLDCFVCVHEQPWAELIGSMHGQLLSVFSDNWKAETSLQKKVCACKHCPFHSFCRKYPVAHPSLWYCCCGTYSSIALEFLSQYWLLTGGVDFICMLEGRSSKNYYKKMSVPDLILQLSPENFGLFWEAAIGMPKHEPG